MFEAVGGRERGALVQHTALGPGRLAVRRRGPGRNATAFLATIALLCLLPATGRGATITRQHLDAGRVQYTGVDINGDEIPDSITQDNIAKTTAYFLVDKRRGMEKIDPLALPEEERRFLPDVFMESDLDGDEIRDLLLYNRDYLLKFADNPAVFSRILANSLYLGQARDTYRDLGSCPLSEEARSAVLAKARELVLQAPR